MKNSKNKEWKFPTLPEVKKRKKITYIITFLFIYILVYGGILDGILDIFVREQSKVFIENASIALIILLLIVLYFVLRENINRDIKEFFKNIKEYFKYAIWMSLVMLTISASIGLILKIITQQFSPNQVSLQDSSLLFSIVYIIVLGPIVEEFVYRGLIRKIFDNKYIFFIMSAVLFGAMHLIGNVTELKQLLYILPYTILGFVLAYSYEKTDNLVVNSVIHMLCNALPTLLTLISNG